ncbi:MAG TPA: SRPBCC family protein [Candidatus Limnocylindrales bacterium]
MLRRVGLLAVLAVAGAWLADRLLAGRRGGTPIPPLEMLAVVDAPIEAVWTVIADVPRQLEWMHDMKSVRIETRGPIGIGTRAEATVRILGIPVTDPVEIVEFDPPSRYAIRHLGLFAGDGLFTLEPGADGTTTVVRWTERLEPPVLPNLGAVVQAPILRAIFQADLGRMKRLVETGAAAG